MHPRHWQQMAERIRSAVTAEGCDAVLLLHGTDTLAYSAAALSFLLLDLPVPVLLTGAMLPAGSEGSDAWPNLFGAMRALQAGRVSGVQLYFNGALLHGARVSKLRSDAFDAFAEAPRQRLANATAERPPALLPRRPAQVMVLPLYPGVGATQVQALVASGAQALLLECYGSGTGRRTTPSSSRRCARHTARAWCWRRSASARAAMWISGSMPPAARCVMPGWSPAAV